MAMNQRYPDRGGFRPGTGRGGDRGPPSASVDQELEIVLKRINLAAPHADMFDGDAQKVADVLKRGQSRTNKSSQIRRFYDELLRYRSHVQDQEGLERVLPFIRMLNARAAYAMSRDLVDANFREFLRTLLGQIKDKTTLRNACTTFEAVIGFSPPSSSQKDD